MRVMGLDMGERRIGVALSDSLGLTAQRLTVIERRSIEQDLDVVAALVATHHVERIIVGLPLTLRGEQGIQADKVTTFAKQLRQHVPVPVEFLDERLTTVQGQRALRLMGTSSRKQKQIIDQVAAQLILQHYLDGQQKAG